METATAALSGVPRGSERFGLSGSQLCATRPPRAFTRQQRAIKKKLVISPHINLSVSHHIQRVFFPSEC